jgi:putative acyl-CoA dehydrogenase
VLPDGTRNGIRLQRLKNKLGNRANASAEIEYDGTLGWAVGAEGRGIPTIIEMVTMTRLDCVLGSAATIRASLSEAAHHVAHRRAFGVRLADAPLMAAVVADLALESEATTALAMRLAAAMDAGERTLLRIALPASKYYVCKRAPAVAAEALECLGGNGYVEDSGLPRLYREAPLNSIWEGSGNITALDVVRALSRDAATADALLAELAPVARACPSLSRAVSLLRAELSDPTPERARRLAVLIALCLQASLLLRHSPAVVAEAFIGSRFGGDTTGWTIGLLPAGTDTRLLVERVTPSLG